MKNCDSPSEWASPHYAFDLLLSNTGVAHCRIFIDRKKTENQFSLTILPHPVYRKKETETSLLSDALIE